MPGSGLVVFRRSARTFVKPAAWAAGGILVAVIAQTHGPLPWMRLPLLVLGGGVAFLALWSLLSLFGRRETITLRPGGIEAPDALGGRAFCAWDTITDAEFIDRGDHSYIRVDARYLPAPLYVSAHLDDTRTLLQLVEREAGENHPLTLALRDAGA